MRGQQALVHERYHHSWHLTPHTLFPYFLLFFIVLYWTTFRTVNKSLVPAGALKGSYVVRLWFVGKLRLEMA